MAQSAAVWDGLVVVVGAGPAGLTAAVALGLAGVETALVSPRAAATDNRTSGLLIGSVAALEMLGAWQLCCRHAVALRGMRVIESSSPLLLTREVAFRARDIGLEVFGYNLENRHLLAALEQRASSLPALSRIEDRADAIVIDETAITVRLSGGGTARAQLAIAADGQGSLCRRAAGIDVHGWRYPQSAIALCFVHARPHDDTSIEFHTRNEPLTLMPLPGRRSSLVLVAERAAVERIAALDEDALSEEIERRSHSILGRIFVEPEQGTFPIVVQTASRFAAERIVLVGEAAHVIPPFGGHGLNLGLRDAATIAELVVGARRAHRDVGSAEMLVRYDTLRRPDSAYLRWSIGLAARLLLSDAGPIQGLRRLSHLLLHGVGPLRRALMREGIAPRMSVPLLMRGEPLGQC
jgi:2-octaprenyl-6-methoxyphenol hydroxylase